MENILAVIDTIVKISIWDIVISSTLTIIVIIIMLSSKFNLNFNLKRMCKEIIPSRHAFFAGMLSSVAVAILYRLFDAESFFQTLGRAIVLIILTILLLTIVVYSQKYPKTSVTHFYSSSPTLLKRVVDEIARLTLALAVFWAIVMLVINFCEPQIKVVLGKLGILPPTTKSLHTKQDYTDLSGDWFVNLPAGIKLNVYIQQIDDKRYVLTNRNDSDVSSLGRVSGIYTIRNDMLQKDPNELMEFRWKIAKCHSKMVLEKAPPTEITGINFKNCILERRNGK